MKKKNVLNLIKYHYNNDENGFRNESLEIVRDFQNSGDEELARYIMAILSNMNTFTPQESVGFSDYFVKLDSPSDTFNIPISIEKDIKGILNAVKNHRSVNKFLFIGASGTGKTEAAKQIARILKRELISIQFDQIVDSKLGQTSKNLVQLFNDINALKRPENVIILFDELDAIALDRVNTNDLREMGRVTSTLLKEFDNLSKDIVLIATTNLYKQFDNALLRRFDYIVNFNRYTREDLITISNLMIKKELKKYDYIYDEKMLNKIYNCVDEMPYPGIMQNIIRSSIAFSDAENKYDYLSKIMLSLTGMGDLKDFKKLQDFGFSLRDIEKLTGKPKSSVAREVNNE